MKETSPKYNPDSFTWGYELEITDVSRQTKIPENLGEWDYSEKDMVNQLSPYWGIAVDPLGIDPPVGGEINTKPTKTIEEQVDKIFQIIDIFKSNGETPTVNCLADGHIHVHVPGLINDIKSLKKLARYIEKNQRL